MYHQAACRRHIYIPDQEWQAFQDRAKAKNLSTSRYVRSLAKPNLAEAHDRRQTLSHCTCQLIKTLNELQTLCSPSDESSKLFAKIATLLDQIEQEVC